MTNKNNQTPLFVFLRENYLAIILGLLIVVSSVSYLFRFQSEKTKTNLINSDSSAVNETDNQQNTNLSLGNKVHLVSKGENLWQISEKYYGSGYNFVDIVKANKMPNANLLAIGQKLDIPAKVKPMSPTVGRVSSTQTALPSITGKSYQVLKGDTLWQIAERAYGNGNLWTKIATTNKIKNPRKLFVGTNLQLPDMR